MLSGQFDWGDLLPKGNKSIVALPAGDGGASIRLYAGTPEYLTLPVRTGDNVLSAGDQQERLASNITKC